MDSANATDLIALRARIAEAVTNLKAADVRSDKLYYYTKSLTGPHYPSIAYDIKQAREEAYYIDKSFKFDAQAHNAKTEALNKKIEDLEAKEIAIAEARKAEAEARKAVDEARKAVDEALKAYIQSEAFLQNEAEEKAIAKAKAIAETEVRKAATEARKRAATVKAKALKADADARTADDKATEAYYQSEAYVQATVTVEAFISEARKARKAKAYLQGTSIQDADALVGISLLFV